MARSLDYNAEEHHDWAMDNEQRFRAFYDAFNGRDTETLLAAMTADVKWPNGWEGGRLQGRDEVRSLATPVGRGGLAR